MPSLYDLFSDIAALVLAYVESCIRAFRNDPADHFRLEDWELRVILMRLKERNFATSVVAAIASSKVATPEPVPFDFHPNDEAIHFIVPPTFGHLIARQSKPVEVTYVDFSEFEKASLVLAVDHAVHDLVVEVEA